MVTVLVIKGAVRQYSCISQRHGLIFGEQYLLYRLLSREADAQALLVSGCPQIVIESMNNGVLGRKYE